MDTATEERPPFSADGAAATYRLDTRVVQLWRLGNLGGAIFVCLPFAAAGISLWLFTPVSKLAIVTVWLIALSILSIQCVWWPRKMYDTWSYQLSPSTLELTRGVIWRISVLIPLSRIQHVDTHRGPLERRLGLASLDIHTAGTKDATHRLPGLDSDMADQLRSQLVDAASVKR